MKNRSIYLTVLAAALALCTAQATAKDYIYGSWNGPKNVVLSIGVGPYLEAVEKETGGSLKWKLLAGAQLFGGRATLAGIRDRVADAGGPVIPAFTRKALRAANVVYDLVNASESSVAMAGAVAETFHLDCPECKADFAKNNTLFLANYAAPRFNILCREAITKAGDLKGRRIRVVGALGRLLKRLGAVPVGGSPAKAVQAVQRGNMDCIAGPVSWLQSFGTWDITKHILDAPLAIQATPSAMVINRDAWKELSRAEKAAMIKHAPRLIAATTLRGYQDEDAMVRRQAPGRGVTITRAGDAMRRALDAHKASELTVVPAIAKKEGVKTAERIVEAHLANVAKWEKIFARTGNDPDKFAQALWDEVFSKLDPNNL